jgi:hypothetical protein
MPRKFRIQSIAIDTSPRRQRFGKWRAHVSIAITLICGLIGLLSNPRAEAGTLFHSREPHIVNVYNFIRNSDFRLANSEDVLFDCTRHQIEVLREAGLPATWALQYDALINPRYQNLLKAQLRTNDEIAAWWEIPQPLAEKAGLKWRGRHEWDPVANVGFSPGYTPDERRKLVDVYMAEFKQIFGRYPRTIGSWYVDEVTLAYMAERYGIIASCNCKDQIGTDFYTLWGGYWNQAYYPSRLNAYMPAQTRRAQIDVPIFRMLGSDPIYEHGTTPGLQSLEPVYPESGGSEKWVRWFTDNLVDEPSLAFAYAQAGQENSFGWAAMKTGFTNQIALYARLVKSGKIRVETLAQTGQWFRKHFPLTPPTSVVAMSDWKNEGRKTVWYDSRFYRVNFLWENGRVFIRDLHCFDEHMVSPTHDTPLTAHSLVYETLPVMDWANWSRSANETVGMWPVLLSLDGVTEKMDISGVPAVREAGAGELEIRQPLRDGGTISIACRENGLNFVAVDGHGNPLHWALNLNGGEKLKSMVRSIKPMAINFNHDARDYELEVPRGEGTVEQSSGGTIETVANSKGELILKFVVSGQNNRS